MATTYKVLGQSQPSANTDVTLYTVPSSTSTIVSTINVCNLGVGSDNFRIAVRPSGNTLANVHYLAYNTVVPGYDSIALTIGITLATTDVITVYSTNGNVVFNAFGSELT